MLSNRLVHLQGAASDAYGRHKRAQAEAIQAYLDCGAALNEAKAACGHGEWLPWLEDAGIPERTAQRMMKLAGADWKSDTVSDVGGIREALWMTQHAPAIERIVRIVDWFESSRGVDADDAVTKLLADVEHDDAAFAERVWDFAAVCKMKFSDLPKKHRLRHCVHEVESHTAH